jgi:hypothetical protein
MRMLVLEELPGLVLLPIHAQVVQLPDDGRAECQVR